MRHTRFFISTLVWLTTALALSAQNLTSSPFSRFGYGELNDNTPGAYRGMGSVGIGMRSNTVINPSQPASYSVVDSTTFMFDMAASGMWSNYHDAIGTRNKGNGNLEYLSLQFPLWKYIGFSIGLMPYSAVGYEMTDSISDPRLPSSYTTAYNGLGGISELYVGLSFNIMNWVAVGANFYYMFGKAQNTRSLAFHDAGYNALSQVSTMHVSSCRLRYGLQVFHNFDDQHAFVLGATFENPMTLHGDFQKLETTTSDTVQYASSGFTTPLQWGVGASYTYHNRLTVAADYSVTQWASARYFGQTGTLRDRGKISIGAEYRHNPLSRKYVERMPWRLGCSISDPYTNIPGKDFTVTLGIGFPLHNVATVINTTFEYGHRGSKATLAENYLRFTVNCSISENWFFKRKL